jgi:hypothetical protein
MYIAHSNQRDFHIYFDNLVDEICEERLPGWKNMKDDPRPQEEWSKPHYLPESHWYWDNAVTINRLHYDCICKVLIQFIANRKNYLKLESSEMKWELSDELMFSDEFVKDIIRAYCSTNDKDEIIAKFNVIVGNANKYKPNIEIINQFKRR